MKPISSPSVGAPTSSALVFLFAGASGLSVANVYYAQPLLDTLAAEFAIPTAAAGAVVTATQLGSALALLLLVPLGDVLDRRRLMLGQAALLAGALALAGAARSPFVLLAAMLLTGLLGTAMTQGLIAYAASTAQDGERGRVVGAAQGGVFIGLLLARVLAGAGADLAGWRSVYFAAALVMLLLALLLGRTLPRLAPLQTRIGYIRLVASVFVLIRQDPVLQVRGTLASLMFAAFNIFWSALVLPLSAPPYSFSHSAIGGFGLVGVVGALAAARAGRWADRGWEGRASLVALLLLLAAWLPLSLMERSLWALVAGIVLLDLGGQALHVTNQSMIFRRHPQAHSRVVAAYMLFYALGSALGGIAATAAFAAGGWAAVCILGAGVSLAALALWAAAPSPQ